MAKPNILHIAPTPFFADRGCHIRIEGIVRCLNELGFSNKVCTYHHGRDVDSVSTSRIKPIKNYTQTEAGPSKYKLWADWRLLCLCVKEYRRLKPAVIHAHLHEGLMIGLVLKLLFFWRRTPLIGDIQGSLTGELEAHGSFANKGFLRWPVRALEQLLVFSANRLVCSSEHSLQQLLNFGVNPAKVSLAQDGADVVNQLSPRALDELRTTLNLPKGKCIAVYSGALLESKGLDKLQQIIKSSTENIHFLIIGYPTDKLASFLRKQQLDEDCTLTGRVPFQELNSYLQLADIAIEPKRSTSGEGSGKILNYLANSLPVIAFKTQNNQSFLPPSASLVESVQEFSRQLQQLAADAPRRAQMAADNLVHFEQYYSWSNTRQQLSVVYTDLKNRQV